MFAVLICETPLYSLLVLTIMLAIPFFSFLHIGNSLSSTTAKKYADYHCKNLLIN